MQQKASLKSMERKLIAFDIDGTLLDDQKRPLPSTFKALEKLRQAGHLVTIATGRSRFHAQEVIRELAFENYILCNGAAAFLNNQQVYKHLLDQTQLQQFVVEANQLQIDTAYIGLDAVKRNSTFDLPKIDDAMTSFDAPMPEYDPDFLVETDIYQGLGFYDSDYDHYFTDQYDQLRFVRWYKNGVDVVPKYGSKAATMLHLAQQVGISPKNIIAFGDGLNDQEMLAEAGIGIAMGNAVEPTRQVADLITDTNENDGIAKALQELALI